MSISFTLDGMWIAVITGTVCLFLLIKALFRKP